MLGVIYAGEVFGNPAGGYRQGTIYNGLLTAGLDVDFGKFIGWNGLKFHALAYESHGANGTNLYTRDINFYSSINAYDSFRLSEIWLQTSLFKNVINLRVGQEEVDAEFATTIGGALFIHSNFGALPTITLNVPTPTYPGGGPRRASAPQFTRRAPLFPGRDLRRQRQRRPRRRCVSPASAPGSAYNDDGIRFPISGNQGSALRLRGGLPAQLPQGRPRPARRLPGGRLLPHREISRMISSIAQYPFLTIPVGRRDTRGSTTATEAAFAVAEQVVYRPRNPRGGNEDVAASAAAPIGNAEDAPLTAGGTLVPSGTGTAFFRPSRGSARATAA